MIDVLNNQDDNQEKEGFLFNKKSDCNFALDLFALNDACVDEINGLVRLQILRDSQDVQSLQAFFQHSGCGVSSHFAEGLLFRKGLIAHREFLTEKNFPYEKITQTITEAHGPSITREDVLLTSSVTMAF